MSTKRPKFASIYLYQIMTTSRNIECISEKAYINATMLLAFSLPFEHDFSSIAFIIWFICFLIYKTKVKEREENINKIQSISILCLFGVGLASLAYAPESDLVLKRMFETRLIMLLLPICCLWGLGKIPFSKLIRAFVWGNSAYLVYSAICGIGNAFELDTETLRSYIREFDYGFMFPVHRIYSCTNIVLANMGLLHLLANDDIKKEEKTGFTLFFIASVTYLIVSNSRMAILMALTLGFCSLLRTIKKNKKLIITYITCFVVTLGVFALVPSRFQKDIFTLATEHTFLNNRSQIWDAATAIIPNNIASGLGTNNYMDELRDEFLREGNDWCGNRDIDCHNAYLEILIENGWTGLIILLATMATVLLTMPKGRKMFGYSFMFLTIGIMFIENYLSRQNGVFMFTFWSIFLSTTNGKENLVIDLPSKAKHAIRCTLPTMAIAGTCLFVYIVNMLATQG